MSKAFVDNLIHNMRLAGIVTKVTPWTFEGIGDQALNVRYLGIKLDSDWQEIFSPGNNILLKFVIDRSTANVEFYLANKPPFVKIITRQFTDADKWEIIIGEVKKRLKRDKIDFQNHREQVGNIYSRIKADLK